MQQRSQCAAGLHTEGEPEAKAEEHHDGTAQARRAGGQMARGEFRERHREGETRQQHHEPGERRGEATARAHEAVDGERDGGHHECGQWLGHVARAFAAPGKDRQHAGEQPEQRRGEHIAHANLEEARHRRR